MTSSEIAFLILGAQVGVAALVVTSIQWRVLKRPPPRRTAYILGWIACIIVVGGLIWMTDVPVGNTSLARRVNSALLVGIVGAAALAAGAWVAGRFPREGRRVVRGFALFFTHLGIVLASALLAV